MDSNNEVHIVTKITTDTYDYSTASYPVIAYTDFITATKYALKADRVFDTLSKFYLEKYNELCEIIDWDIPTELEEDQLAIYSDKYEKFKRTCFSVDSVKVITV